MSALGVLIGEIAIKALGKKIQKKLDREPKVKKAAENVVSSLHEAPGSTLTGATFGIAAIFVGAFDLSPEMTEQLIPYAQEILTAVLGIAGAWIATLQKK